MSMELLLDARVDVALLVGRDHDLVPDVREPLDESGGLVVVAGRGNAGTLDQGSWAASGAARDSGAGEGG